MWADIVNGCYEGLAGLFILNHCRLVLKERDAKGISVVSLVFFSTWGVWNLYYYPSLGQWMSFYGGLSIVSANILYVLLVLKFRKKR
jgi:hypothetical protein